jgi:hypothetical protein
MVRHEKMTWFSKNRTSCVNRKTEKSGKEMLFAMFDNYSIEKHYKMKAKQIRS